MSIKLTLIGHVGSPRLVMLHTLLQSNVLFFVYFAHNIVGFWYVSADSRYTAAFEEPENVSFLKMVLIFGCIYPMVAIYNCNKTVWLSDRSVFIN